MKWLFFALLLANLILAAWNRLASPPPSNPLAHQSLHPELLKLLSEKAQPAPISAPAAVSEPAPVSAAAAASAPVSAPAPVKVQTPVKVPVSAPVPAKTAPPALACYKWGPFTTEVDDAKKAIAKLSPSASVKTLALSNAALGFWVYLAPAHSADDAALSVKKLNAMGIKDHFMVKQTGKWQYAVSLGIFHTPMAAKNYAATLRKKGLEAVKWGKRDGGEVELLIGNLPAAAAPRLALGKARLEKINCASIRGKASRD